MLVSGAIAGTILGAIVGRDWGRLERLDVRWLPVLLAALAVRLVAFLFGNIGLELDAIAITATGVVAFVNRRLPGMVLIAAGSLLNLAVTVINSGMPVDIVSLVAAGGPVPHDALHVPINEGTRLREFGDVLIVGSLGAAYSVGDLLIALGGFLVPFMTLARQ